MQLMNEATQMEHDNSCEYAKIRARPLQLISVSYPDTRRKRMNKTMKNLNRTDCNLIHSLSAGPHSLELLYIRHIRTRNTTATFPHKQSDKNNKNLDSICVKNFTAYHTSYKLGTYTNNREIPCVLCTTICTVLSLEYALVPSRPTSQLLIGFSMVKIDISLRFCPARFPIHKPQSPGRTGD